MNLAFNDIYLDDGWGRSFKWFIGLSLLFHGLALYFAVNVLPNISLKPLRQETYTVTLVSAPTPPPAPAAPANTPVNPDLKIPDLQPVPPAAPPTESAPAELVKVPEPAPPEPETVSIQKRKTPPTPEIKPKEKPEKTPPPKEEPVKKTPPKAVAKPKAGRSVEQKLNRRMKELQAKVQAEKEQQKIDSAIANLVAKRSMGDGDSLGSPSLSGSGPVSELDSRMRDYYVILFNVISANWNMPPEKMFKTDTKDLEAVYNVRLDRSGKVLKRWFEKESGEPLFDASAEKAVTKSNFPPLPDVFDGDFIDLGFRFTPDGIGKK